MTEPESSYGDPITRPFWDAASQRRLVVQRCRECESHQFYPRPLCISCSSDDLEWVEVSGRATIYSMTTVHIQMAPEFDPPYVVAVVELEEGPRMLTNIEGGEAHIGDAVGVAWRDREDLPPVPVWHTHDGQGG